MASMPGLAETQEPYVREYWEQNPRVDVVSVGQEGHRAAFPLDDLRDHYVMACLGHFFGEEGNYAALGAVLDPARYVLHLYPTLARVVGRIIGKDEFWMQILGGGSTSPTDLIAGLMTRAVELPECRFRTAASEWHAFLELGPEPFSRDASVPQPQRLRLRPLPSIGKRPCGGP